ncbi:DUF368 domain-containing protein [Natronobacterium gregoryi]|uniref:DUF368 domain-containing protein n=2 Tax=Natronobacterium gregoryi TaxID=44930 RepID=L0AF12_NATGS|nr:DUF368 domain-containing protein [Natronobacterium gregoryi]AFZ72019.1 putative membrane protein [Natronobacterium gregoryi SP2]ELY62707.1 hypothetical protein C490_17382 [Natronobacterium gregoryi SP2]PLK20868.1 DUF368 domain-containing protein [Natronobacterium gregoryi SP2]SFJ20099.1 putative membrane protein [Natronobacterium gregoryi]
MGYNLEERAVDRLELLRVYAYGLCMGTADALPGVSGGTVALLLGFYGRLIAAITALTPARVVDVCRGYDPARRKRAREALLEMDLQFLLPLGVGMVTAVALIAGAVSALAESKPIALFGFFTGLIAASAVVLFRSLPFPSLKHALAASAGTVLALLVASGVVELPGSGALLIFLSGALAISAMILPGISGALILILLGQYVFLSDQLTAFLGSLGALVSGNGTLEGVIGPGTTVVLFVAGGFLGLVTIARIVRRALDYRRELTLLFLVGLIAGSIPAPLHNIGEVYAWTTDIALLTGAWAIVGAVALFGLDALAGGFDPE